MSSAAIGGGPCLIFSAGGIFTAENIERRGKSPFIERVCVMKILITGASTGIGREMARKLGKAGNSLILVARNEKLLNELKEEIGGNCAVFASDLAKAENCESLYEKFRNENIDVLINNAGFGLFGRFEDTPLEREMNMIDLNIKAVHILTKRFLGDFEERGCGYILNVASSAAFLPGPLMAVYYATKAYVLRLTEAVSEELRRSGSKVYIGALCPGPVDTEFNRTAGVKFNLKSLSADEVAAYAIKNMFKKKTVIIPGKTIKLGVFFRRLTPPKLLLRIAYNIQKSKG